MAIAQPPAAVMSMRRHGPDGELLPDTAYVFGNETGEQVKDIKRAWTTARLKAHGYTVKWAKGRPGGLEPESIEALEKIDLHFHDLRHEFLSAYTEAGNDVHDTRDWVNHSSLTMTNRYVNSTEARLEKGIVKLEEKRGVFRTRSAQTAETTDAPAKGEDGKRVN